MAAQCGADLSVTAIAGEAAAGQRSQVCACVCVCACVSAWVGGWGDITGERGSLSLLRLGPGCVPAELPLPGFRCG